MFIAELCGSWMDHPFYKNSFLLDKQADLRALRDSAVGEVWIDPARGLDVTDPAAPAASAAQVRAENEAALVEAATSEDGELATTSIDEELTAAREICGRAREAVGDMFREARMGRVVDEGVATELVADIEDSIGRNAQALISLARLKTADDYTYMHSVAVCGLMIALAKQLGVPRDVTSELGLAGLLHDVGKAAVPLNILNKPGKLTDAEFSTMKSHPVAGFNMLSSTGHFGDIPLEVCLHHHEKVDGSGYPDRLAGDNLSLYAKMGAVTDVYDAITSDRPYKRGWDPATAVRKMNEWTNGHFDAAIFQAFVKTVGIYPVGGLVRLSSGLLAVVCEQGDALLEPIVQPFYCTRSKRTLRHARLNLGDGNCGDKIEGVEDPARWPFKNLDSLWLPDNQTPKPVAA